MDTFLWIVAVLMVVAGIVGTVLRCCPACAGVRGIALAPGSTVSR